MVKANEEQELILNSLADRKSQITSILALAGTGKSTTLKMAASGPLEDYRIRYFVFNSRNAREADGEFPSNTTTSTAHSFAFKSKHPDTNQSMANVYAKRLKESVYRYLTEAAQFDHQFGLHLRAIRVNLGLSPSKAIIAILSVINRFNIGPSLIISREEISKDLVRLTKIDPQDSAYESLINAASYTYAKMRDPRSNCPVDHGTYLKLLSIEPPRIYSDYVFFDESQDANAPMARIIDHQLQFGTGLVAVGDSNQQIYGFAGGINALDMLTKRHADRNITYALRSSYRFGPEIAEAANIFLRYLKSEHLLIGLGKPGSVGDSSNEADCYLYRSNVGLINSVVEMVDKHAIHVVGGVDDAVKLLKGAQRLYAGQESLVEELSPFETWQDLIDFTEENATDSNAVSLKPIIKLMEQNEGNPDKIIRALERTVTAKSASRSLSTIHQSKGGQWKRVNFGDDVATAWQGKINGDQGRIFYLEPSADEVKLDFVAMTRATDQLTTNTLMTSFSENCRFRKNKILSDAAKAFTKPLKVGPLIVAPQGQSVDTMTIQDATKPSNDIPSFNGRGYKIPSQNADHLNRKASVLDPKSKGITASRSKKIAEKSRIDMLDDLDFQLPSF